MEYTINSMEATRLWQLTQTSIIEQAVTILSCRSRILPRASPRALTLTQPYTTRPAILGGASGLRRLDGLVERFAHFVRITCISITRGQNDEGIRALDPDNRLVGFIQAAAK